MYIFTFAGLEHSSSLSGPNSLGICLLLTLSYGRNHFLCKYIRIILYIVLLMCRQSYKGNCLVAYYIPIIKRCIKLCKRIKDTGYLLNMRQTSGRKKHLFNCATYV